MIRKIRYRLVYNRKKKLNKQGEALVQLEALLGKRKVYFSTRVYLRPSCWNPDSSLVVNHPQENLLNAFLYSFMIDVQKIELDLWKIGVETTLSLLRDKVRESSDTDVLSFIDFARNTIEKSDRSIGTKSNMMSTVKKLQSFKNTLTFEDITYEFVSRFEVYLKQNEEKVNTVAKHLRQLRTLVNEAINNGYMKPDRYPFRKFKIRTERTEHKDLTVHELEKIERIHCTNDKQEHVRDAFLFCCYTGLRFSDFKQLDSSKIKNIRGKTWIIFTSIKTGHLTKVPLSLMFNGKPNEILSKYSSIEDFASIWSNVETNRILKKIIELAKIGKTVTFHSARHTCASILLYNKVPITTVQALLGHSSVRTTQIYSHVRDSTIEKDLSRM